MCGALRRTRQRGAPPRSLGLGVEARAASAERPGGASQGLRFRARGRRGASHVTLGAGPEAILARVRPVPCPGVEAVRTSHLSRVGYMPPAETVRDTV